MFANSAAHGWRRRKTSANHLAAAFKDHSVFHTKAGRVDVASEDGGLVNLDSVSSLNLAAHFTADNHGPRLNLCLDSRSLANDERIRGIDFSTKHAANSNGSQKAQLTLELTAWLNDASDCRVNNARAQTLGFSHDLEFCMAATIRSSCSESE